MTFNEIYTAGKLDEKANALFKEERAINRLDGWFLARETVMEHEQSTTETNPEIIAAQSLAEVVERLPIYISEHSVFAGAQRDAFARSYALINPSFRVASFSGYCDPTAVFGDIEPSGDITAERIERVREYNKTTPYVKNLTETYASVEQYTKEVAFFVEQVTGHLIPDFKGVLASGTDELIRRIDANAEGADDKRRGNFEAMKITLTAAVRLAERYADIAADMQKTANGDRKKELALMENTLRKVPASGASNLYEAIQSFMILWQVMCIEQAPNPFAFSVGNADRIFESYRSMGDTGRQEAAGLLKHLLVFYNVADRSWAISQNLIVSGKNTAGDDLTNETTYALLDAYYDMNLPQPILSVKLHGNTPDKLYRELGRFFFTPGCLTPSIFNDDAMFDVLRKSGIAEEDLENYSVAGCQEPLIMGKDNGNTTNSWLNLAKILELTLNDGRSLLSGEKIGLSYKELGVESGDINDVLSDIRAVFYKHVQYFVDIMANAANGASRAVSHLPVPFLSAFMGGAESGIDLRDPNEQGTAYNGSGCLIHGLTVISDSFVAIDKFMSGRPNGGTALLEALRADFDGDEDLRNYLLSCPKFGNNIMSVDDETIEVCSRVSEMVSSAKNYLGNPFRADWSSPSTHLLYGYHVGATPDGRRRRDMLGYGVDPLYGEAQNGLGFRTLSALKLPYELMNGGYASHFGVDPNYFSTGDYEQKGLDFKNRIIKPLFFNDGNGKLSPFYLYVNVTTPEILRKVMENPKKYAPSGVYIMRIHGTFVNFLDLSPEIQKDIITRLDLKSTAIA